MLAIKEKIEKSLNHYKKELEVVTSFNRVYRKNGENFKNILENFKSDKEYPIYFDYSFMDNSISSVKIGYDTIYMYREDENRGKIFTVEELEKMFNKTTQKYKNYILREEQNLKDLEKNFIKFEKIINQLRQFKKKL